jgi:peptidyl-prolyl cis-trans isomerase SDCCAG10
MSDIYITEPPTSGKVIIETNYGNIDIELFTLEAPKSCKNFIQHCLNKYYNGCIFFKIFKNFMIQTGDPTNTGNGGESIYSEDFRDEFHSRLKFNHRGIVAMANKDKPNTNGSQFFITLDKCQEMDKKFTIFGKVTGPTFFNALNISNLSADEDGNPIMNDDEKPKILNTEVVINPFNDLKPTVTFENDNIDKEKNNKIKKKKKKLKIKYTSDKMFFKDEDNEEEKDKNEKEKNEVDENEFKEKKDNNDEKNIHFFKEDDKNNKDKNEDNTEDKNFKNEQNAENEEKKDEIEEDSNEEKNKNEKVENADENDEESESKSLSSENHIVQNAKQILGDDEDNIPKKKKKNINDYKKEINLLRKKVKREKEEKLNDDDNIRKKVEEEKINKMNILQKYNYDYVKSNQANKLSTDERANKLKNFKSFIGGGDSTGWFKTKLKFQTDSQKAFTLDMINKELEKNE